MTTMMETDPATVVAAWRAGAEDSPAGPLFASRYTESELTVHITADTGCGPCTGSRTIDCF